MEKQFKQMASLIGDPVRATIMWNLMDGKALTATELALMSDTSPQNISMHLTKLVEGGLLSVENQGRHRYYKYSRKEIAYAIEALTTLLSPSTTKENFNNENFQAIKYCRTCYDHLAGKIGVAITDKLLKQRIIVTDKQGFELTNKGKKWFADLGIDIDELQLQRRSFLRPCLDWSERRHHIAGSLAAALLDKMLSSDWIRRTKNSRAMVITSKGQKVFYEMFTISV